MTSEAPNPSSLVGLPFSLRPICACAQVCVCVHKSLCGAGASSVAQRLGLGFHCRGPGVISGCGNSAGLRLWQKKKSLYDIVFLFPLDSAVSFCLLALSLSPLPLYLVLPPLPTAPEPVVSFR